VTGTFGPWAFAGSRLDRLRNVEVGGSSPLTSTSQALVRLDRWQPRPVCACTLRSGLASDVVPLSVPLSLPISLLRASRETGGPHEPVRLHGVC
jgi:hypothetical protein